MPSVLHAITHPSVSVTRVDLSKMVEVRIMKFSLYGSPPSLQFLWDKFHPEILMESPDTNNVDKLQTEND